jgi:hypothetical protein
VLAGALRDAYYDPTLVTDADVDAYYAPTRSRNGLTAFLARMRRDTTLDRSGIVRGIRAPTLIILGRSTASYRFRWAAAGGLSRSTRRSSKPGTCRRKAARRGAARDRRLEKGPDLIYAERHASASLAAAVMIFAACATEPGPDAPRDSPRNSCSVRLHTRK